MQNERKLKFTFGSVCLLLMVAFAARSRSARAELRNQQSFRPIEWESDFVAENCLSVTGMKLTNGAQIVSLADQKLHSAYGLQLSQRLRDQWTGRVGLFVGRTGPSSGQYVWTMLGSDLQHPLVPTDLYDHSLFKIVRPSGFFGLGVVSRWENAGLGLNLIPTLRYELSEPIVQAGLLLQSPVAEDVFVEFEYRLIQSARTSRVRGSGFAVSFVWGRITAK